MFFESVRLWGCAATCNVLILIVAATSCAKVEPAAECGVEELDSARVTLVTNRNPQWTSGDEWVVPRVPVLRIGSGETGDGSDNPGPFLFQVSAVLVVGDSQIVIGNTGSGQIISVDTTGRVLWTAGSKGSGPGEYQYIQDIWNYRGDSLLAWDRRQFRFSVLDRFGRFGRSFRRPEVVGEADPLAASLLGISGRSLAIRGTLDDGRLVGLMAYRMSQQLVASVSRELLPVFVTDQEGRAQDSIVALEGPQVYRGPEMQGVLAFSGEPQIVVSRDLIYIGNGDEYRIDVVDPTGSLRLSVRRQFSRLPVRDEDVASERERRRERLRTEFAGWPEWTTRSMRRFAEEVPHADSLPAFSSFLVDSEGNLWVRRFEVARDSRTFDVFEREGRWLGPVQIPAGFELYDIGRNMMVGLERDEFDIEYVTLYRIRK